jgi:two-component system, OmpR family, phosphate regulon sensor histidine kinase PhoR
MAMATDRDRFQPPRSPDSFAGRLYRARHVLVAAALVFAGLALLGTVTLAQACIGFIVVGGATLVGEDFIPRSADDGVVVRGRPQGVDTDLLVDTLISALPDPAVTLNQDGLVVALNARALALAPALRRGEPTSIALRMPELVAAIRQAIASGAPQRVEFSQRVPIERWSEAFVTPFTLGGATSAASRNLVLVTIHDLTPLQRVEQMRADFVANASHELRTPLASLSGFIETLQGSAREDAIARQKFLAIMKDQATRMARLIDDLLSLSRIELNVHVRPQTPIDLVPLVRQVVDGLQMLARDRGVEIKVAAPTTPVIVPGDRDELIRVCENLVENALKYGASGKRVDITLSAVGPSGNEAEETAISVRDYGPGIAPEHLPRLTERFYRVDVVESRAQGGTGLGLALVKHIVAHHRGRLSIESDAGRGATFTVRLPKTADETVTNRNIR